jgi:hypothetical protein
MVLGPGALFAALVARFWCCLLQVTVLGDVLELFHAAAAWPCFCLPLGVVSCLC